MIGARAMLKALLLALLEPTETLRRLEAEGDTTARLALLEELKTLPCGRGLGSLLPHARRARRRATGWRRSRRTSATCWRSAAEPNRSERGDRVLSTLLELTRDQQGVCRRPGAQGGLVRPAGRRSPRAGRRERRGQVDADQGDHRRPSAGRGNDRGPGPAGRRTSTRSERASWGSPRSTSSRRSSRT